MIHKVVIPEKNEVTDKKYLNSIGGFNDMPEPYEEANFKHFYRYFFSYVPEEIESKQVIDKDFKDVVIYYYHDVAFAIARKIINYGKDFEIKIYRIGCKHKWNVYPIENCLRKEICSKCGIEQVIDSSG